METLWAIVVWAVFGLVVGALARFLVPGRQAMGILMTMVLGIIGSFAGGLVAWMFRGFEGEPLQASGWIMSLLGAIVVLAIYVAMANRRAGARV
jgi:uncharacterized membrane protein YeaQ/YmgE (transglycosylase-associated protein family)